MKGLMVALLTLLITGSALAQDSGETEKDGWFVLKLDEQELRVLLSNPEGLKAPLPKEVRNNVTHIVVKLKDFKADSGNQSHTTGREGFEVTSAQAPSLDPNTGRTQRIGATPDNSSFSNNGRFNRGSLGNQGLQDNQSSLTGGGQFGTRNQLGDRQQTPNRSRSSSTILPQQRPFDVANNQTQNQASTQTWIPFGDNTDFMPVTQPNWLQRGTGTGIQDVGQPNGLAGSNPIRPNLSPDQDQRWQNQQRDTGNDLNFNQSQTAGLNMPRRQQPVNNLPNHQFDNRRQLAQNPAPQTNAQQRQTLDLIERQNAMMTQQQKKIEELERRLQLQSQPQTFDNRPFNPTQVATNNPFNQPINPSQTDPLRSPPIAYPSNGFPNRYANNVMGNRLTDDQRDVISSVPPRRLARNDAKPSTSPRLPAAQIPGPQEQGSTPDASQVVNGNKQVASSEVLGQNQSLRKTNTFLLFMLLCSIGLNAYLGLIARSFYMRYAELADELRETFTATM